MPRPAKKVAPAAAPVSTRRKPGPKPKAQRDEAVNVEGSTKAFEESLINGAGAILLKLSEAGEELARVRGPQLDHIEVIDLRGVNVFGRFHVINLLQNAGYSFTFDPEKPATDATHYWLHTETLKLNHRNKLISPEVWSVVKASTAIVKVLSASASVNVDFSDALPTTVEINGELFERK